MFKKIAKRIVALSLIVVVFATTLIGCATKLHGTYTSSGLIKQSFTFKEDNKVVISAFDINAEGTYKIEDGKIIITYSLLGLSYDWKKDFEKKGESIFIDGTEFIKE